MSGSEKMPGTKIDAFFKEFGWLSKYVRKESVNSVFVGRVDHKLLLHSAEKEDVGDFLPEYVYESLYFLDENGKDVGRVGLKLIPAKNNYRWWKFWTWSNVVPVHGETVYEAVQRLRYEGMASAFYLLSVFSSKVIVYKAPKEYTIQEWIEHQHQLERQAIREELGKIDAEALA